MGPEAGRLIVNNRALGSTVKCFVWQPVLRQWRRHDHRRRVEFEQYARRRQLHRFRAHGDQFIGNDAESEFDHGGLVVLGTEDISNAGGGSNNTVNVRLWGSRMLGNDMWDLAGIGARSLSEQTASLSQNNRVTIEIHGEGNGRGRWQPVELFADQLPATPNYGNSMTVIR